MKIVSAKTLVAAALIAGGVCALPAQPVADTDPFKPRNSAQVGGPAPTENAPIELRGIVSTKAGYLYGLYDPSKRQSVWVRKNDPSAEFVVRSHDVGNETVNVDYQGRTMTLALKAAKIETMPNVPNPGMAGPRGPNMVTGQPVAPQPPQMNPSAAQEAARLEAVAAEVRRRRMLRQAAVQNGQPQPQQAAPPMPAAVNGQPVAVPQPR